MIRPASGGSRPAISLSVVVLPAPVGPRSTKSSPSPMVRSIAATAVTLANRLVRPETATSAMTRSFAERGADGAAGRPLEQRGALGAEREADHLARRRDDVGREPGLDLAVPGVDRDDLGGAEILGAEDGAAQRRGIVEADVLRPDAEGEICLGPVLPDGRHRERGAIDAERGAAGRERRPEVEEVHRRR